MVQFAADGFVGLRSDIFGRHYERSALETVTSYVVIWACVFMIIFFLFNFAIAVVFMSYAKLQSCFKKMIEKDKADVGNVQVRALSLFAWLSCLEVHGNRAGLQGSPRY
jgi:predicted membrane protein